MKTCIVLLFGAVAALAFVAADAPKKSDKVLRHVVLFKFKDDAKKEDVQKVIEAFAELPKKVDSIIDFEWGTDVGAENLAQGFTHCFLVTFRDTEGRDKYLPHPAHEDFKKLVGPVLDKVLVVDYWSQR